MKLKKSSTEKQKEVRNDYLNGAVDIISKNSYKFVKHLFSNSKKVQEYDPKFFKEICTAVKEAIGLTQAIDKNDASSGEELKVIFECDESYFF